jgi:hypothetical protein
MLTIPGNLLDKVRCTLGGDWSRLGSPQMVQPNMLSYFGLLSVMARFGIPRALTLTHLVAFQPPELCGWGFTQWHSATASVCTFTFVFVFPVAERLFDTGTKDGIPNMYIKSSLSS